MKKVKVIGFWCSYDISSVTGKTKTLLEVTGTLFFR